MAASSATPGKTGTGSSPAANRATAACACASPAATRPSSVFARLDSNTLRSQPDSSAARLLKFRREKIATAWQGRAVPARFFRDFSLVLGVCAIVLGFDACVASGRFRAQPLRVPQFVELQEERSISTFHFPRGVYSLDSEDARGYYYRAPRRLIKHSFAGFDSYDGGIFVRKGNRTSLRGYVIWAGGRTQIGNLSQARFVFRN